MGRQEREERRAAAEANLQQQLQANEEARTAERQAIIDGFTQKSAEELRRMAVQAYFVGEHQANGPVAAAEYAKATSLIGFALFTRLQETGELSATLQTEA
jgi:hypothetical protein